jgi:hypothetical protein
MFSCASGKSAIALRCARVTSGGATRSAGRHEAFTFARRRFRRGTQPRVARGKHAPSE